MVMNDVESDLDDDECDMNDDECEILVNVLVKIAILFKLLKMYRELTKYI